MLCHFDLQFVFDVRKTVFPRCRPPAPVGCVVVGLGGSGWVVVQDMIRELIVITFNFYFSLHEVDSRAYE